MISHEKARNEITAIYNDNTQVSCEYLLEYIAQNEQQSNDFIEKYESLEIKYFQFVQDTKRLIYLYSISYDTVRQSERYFSKASYEENKHEHEYKHEYDIRMQKEIDELETKLKGHRL